MTCSHCGKPARRLALITLQSERTSPPIRFQEARLRVPMCGYCLPLIDRQATGNWSATGWLVQRYDVAQLK